MRAVSRVRLHCRMAAASSAKAITREKNDMDNSALDDILDSALDDLEAETVAAPTPAPSAPQPTSTTPLPAPVQGPSIPPPSGLPAGFPAGFPFFPPAAANAAAAGSATDQPPAAGADAEMKEFQQFVNMMKEFAESKAGREMFAAAPPGATNPADIDPDQIVKELQALMEQMPQNPAAPGSAAPQPPSASSSSSSSSSGPAPAAADAGSASSMNDFQSSIDRAFRMIAEGTKAAGGPPPPGGFPAGPGGMPFPGGALDEESLQKLMKELDAMTEKGDLGPVDGMVEQLMQQMMGREFLLPPIKDITDKYPKWMQENESKLSPEDRVRYTAQMNAFQKLRAALERENEDKKEIMDLMQQMQQYGQPPPEIVAAVLPPGTSLDPQGMPTMPPGAVPDLPPGSEKMFEELSKNGDCSVM